MGSSNDHSAHPGAIDAPGAQPARLDGRPAEIVSLLDRGITEAHTDPHTERLIGAAVARLDCLLHLNRARQRLSGTIKRVRELVELSLSV
jgi:hypothetical protein